MYENTLKGNENGTEDIIIGIVMHKKDALNAVVSQTLSVYANVCTSNQVEMSIKSA